MLAPTAVSDTAADQGDSAGGVVGRAEGALAPAREIKSATTDRGDGGGLKRFFFAGIRQQAWQARGQQGLAATGRSDQEQVMASGRRDLQRASRMDLAAHVGQIQARAAS